jgi:hypothetical protein
MPNRKHAGTVIMAVGRGHGQMLTAAARDDVSLADLAVMRLVDLPRSVLLAAVVSLRARGTTWAAIGEALGTSAGAAHMRFAGDVRQAHSARSEQISPAAGR